MRKEIVSLPFWRRVCNLGCFAQTTSRRLKGARMSSTSVEDRGEKAGINDEYRSIEPAPRRMSMDTLYLSRANVRGRSDQGRISSRLRRRCVCEGNTRGAEFRGYHSPPAVSSAFRKTVEAWMPKWRTSFVPNSRYMIPNLTRCHASACLSSRQCAPPGASANASLCTNAATCAAQPTEAAHRRHCPCSPSP